MRRHGVWRNSPHPFIDFVMVPIERASGRRNIATDRSHEISMADVPHAASQASHTHRLDNWLSALVARAGSDLLLVAGVPASIRFEGVVQPLDAEKLSGAEIEAAVLPALIPRALQQY